MKPYDPLKGVPRFSYYLKEIVCFGDFECQEQTKITFTSKDKNECIIC